MGVNSVSCSLSGLTLYDEPAWFVPLVKAKISEPLKGARLTGYNSQACVLFAPLALPYKGQLNEYGYIETFDEDENISLIKESTGMPIKDFTKACIWGDELLVNREQCFAAGCFIHPDIYDRFSKPVTGGKYAASLWMGTFAGIRHLEAIGCKFSHEVEGRYKYVYKHPSIPGISFCSDGRFSEVVDDATGRELYANALNKIHRDLGRSGFPVFPKEDVKRARSISELQTFYQSEACQILESEMFPFIVSPGEFRFLDNGMSEDLFRRYIEVFAQGRLLDRIEQLTYLLDSFTCANRILMPTITGSQQPEHQETSIITGCIDKIAKERLIKDTRES